MPPAITDFFGASATLDTTTPSNPKLTIALGDFSAQGFSNTAKATDPEAWAVALIKKWRAHTVANPTDESSNLAVDAPFKGATTRDNQPKIEYSYSARVYEPDTTSAEPDPDNV